MKEIRVETHINSNPYKVWKILSETENYMTWNPFIRSISGELAEGKRLEVELSIPDKSPAIIRPRILKIVEDRELRWRGRLPVPGLFRGEHIFELVKQADGTTLFVHRELFSGLLVPFFGKILDNNTRRGFEMMNLALKERCEKRSM